jgi:hypothetical protein
MKGFYLILFSILFVGNITKIELKEFYQGFGVVFHSNHEELLKYSFLSDTFFTPTLDDIIFAENILHKDYYSYEKLLLESNNQSSNLIKTKFKNPKNVVKKYFQYNRQYFGYIKDGDSIVQINLFNFSNKKLADELFFDIESNTDLGNGHIYYENQDSFTINLNEEKIIIR